MKKATLVTCLLLASIGAGAAQATCIYPREPESIPDGATATYDEMVAAQQTVKQFDADITAYTACLEMELQAMLEDPGLDEARKIELQTMQAKKNNAAVDHVQSVAERFNEQLRAFQAAKKKD
jgi:opacity protein-like surface antigen